MRWFIVSWIGLALLGCTTETVPQPADPDKGKQALQKGLETWKNQEKAETLRSQQPKIHFADEDWLMGYELHQFQIAEKPEILGHNLRWKVQLELSTKTKKNVKKTVVYRIGTDPELTVVREDS